MSPSTDTKYDSFNKGIQVDKSRADMMCGRHFVEWFPLINGCLLQQGNSGKLTHPHTLSHASLCIVYWFLHGISIHWSGQPNTQYRLVCAKIWCCLLTRTLCSCTCPMFYHGLQLIQPIKPWWVNLQDIGLAQFLLATPSYLIAVSRQKIASANGYRLSVKWQDSATIIHWSLYPMVLVTGESLEHLLYLLLLQAVDKMLIISHVFLVISFWLWCSALSDKLGQQAVPTNVLFLWVPSLGSIHEMMDMKYQTLDYFITMERYKPMFVYHI